MVPSDPHSGEGSRRNFRLRVGNGAKHRERIACRAARRATTWLSMSPAAAPVSRQAPFSAGCDDGYQRRRCHDAALRQPLAVDGSSRPDRRGSGGWHERRRDRRRRCPVQVPPSPPRCPKLKIPRHRFDRRSISVSSLATLRLPAWLSCRRSVRDVRFGREPGDREYETACLSSDAHIPTDTDCCWPP